MRWHVSGFLASHASLDYLYAGFETYHQGGETMELCTVISFNSGPKRLLVKKASRYRVVLRAASSFERLEVFFASVPLLPIG